MKAAKPILLLLATTLVFAVLGGVLGADLGGNNPDTDFMGRHGYEQLAGLGLNLGALFGLGLGLFLWWREPRG